MIHYGRDNCCAATAILEADARTDEGRGGGFAV
jgi:hypothetical protein